MRALFHRFGLALGLAIALLNLEGNRVVAAAAAEIAGEWDAYTVSRGAPVIAAAAAAVVLAVVVAFSAFMPLMSTRRGRLAWAVAMSMIAVPFALELSTGRRARVPAMRVPFVLGVTLSFAVIAGVVAPYLYTRRQRWMAPLLGFAALTVALFADVRMLPRLYPVFHHALLAAAAIGIVLLAAGLAEVLPLRARDGLAALGLLALLWVGLRVPSAGRDLAKYDNARRILDERSALLGRAVALASRRWPPTPLDDPGEGPDPLAQSSTRALDATGRDLLLITVDALRADHVGAYGYPRKTTPTLDALAAEGCVFDRAYTATPHTSYAIASLMTGKYMRPILALEAAGGGARKADETWAGLFRTYGFRTAEFYPPAIWAVDGDRFAPLVQRKLDFEFFKDEFAAPDLRRKQIGEYVASAPPGKPLFVWLHLFEPHEPYVAHAAHDFGPTELDRYDSEIAAADAGIGAVVKDFRAARPGAIVIVSADHGEAFGEHGARYHGTTVYEEQVRVPLIVSAPGLIKPHHIDRPVQLIDLMPTMLSAYGIPRPPRVRGLDLGGLLAGRDEPGEGIAFAEVEDMAMLARGSLRLVCNRRTVTCPLFDLARDPLQLYPLLGDPNIDRLRREMAAVIAGSARLEGFSAGNSWPEALRRGYAGDVDAAIEVAALLDDVDVGFRRRAAEVLARLASPLTETHVRRALEKEKDEITHKWLAIARLRTAREHPASPGEIARVAAIDDRHVTLAVGERFAALAVGEAVERGGVSPGPVALAKIYGVLVDWFPIARADADLGRAILRVLPVVFRGSIGVQAKRATKALGDALGDVRLRVEAANTLGALGDPEAATVLEKVIAGERHVDARIPEVIALARVGAGARALIHLVRYLGVPEPPPGAADALPIVVETPHAWLATKSAALLVVPKGSAHRLIVVGAKKVRAKVHGVEVAGDGIVELGDRLAKRAGEPVAVNVTADEGKVLMIALVPRVDDLPPPKPDRSLPEAHEK